MNKIYLDKLCDFALTTYKNYFHVNKNFDFGDYINNVKQNLSLNEKGIFLKHNFLELKVLVQEIEYEQMVLINPLCFNLSGNIEWFNFLNATLTVLNDNYLHEPNLIKKTILETADKTFRKKINISNVFDDKIIESVCELTNITLILMNNKNKIRFFNSNNKINKIVIMLNQDKEYFSILNWNQKYYNLNSQFVKYLISCYHKNENLEITHKMVNSKDTFIVINSKKKTNILNFDNDVLFDKKKRNMSKVNKSKINNNMFEFDDDITVDENISDNDDINETQDKIVINEEQNKDAYKELQADVNYAMYISEVIDNEENNNKEIISIEKKKKKNNKNIFVVNKKETKENNDDNLDIKNIILEHDENQSSVFNKTEKLNNKDIEKICNATKISMTLESIQANALKLGINIFEGSTKSGKPKNKTKSELVDQIKEFAKNM